jgi:hypothetical protein
MSAKYKVWVQFPSQTSEMCDGIGRHVGLKILCLEINVRVQVPPQLKSSCDVIGKHIVFRMQVLKVQILPRAFSGSLMVERPAHNG